MLALRKPCLLIATAIFLAITAAASAQTNPLRSPLLPILGGAQSDPEAAPQSANQPEADATSPAGPTAGAPIEHATGGQPAAGPPSDEQAAAQLKVERKEVAEKLRVAQRQEVAANAKPKDTATPAANEAGAKEIELLERVEITLAQRQSAVDKKKELEQTRKDLAEQLDQLRTRGPNEPQPYRFALLESVANSLAVEKERLDTDNAAIQAATARRDRAKEELEQREAKRREVREAASVNKEPAKTGALATELKLAELQVKLGATTLELRQAELDNLTLARAVQQLRVTLLEEKKLAIQPFVKFTQEDVDAQLLEIRQQEEALKRQISLQEAEQQYTAQKWSSARTRAEQQGGTNPAIEAEVARWHAAQGMLQRRTLLQTKQLEWLTLARSAWKNRYKVESEKLKPAELSEIESEARETLAAFAVDRQLLERKLADTRKEYSALDAKRDAVQDSDSPRARWLRDHQTTLQKEVDLENQQVARLDEVTRLHEKLLESIAERSSNLTIQVAAQKFWDQVVRYWNFELFSSGDDRVTVGKVVLGVLLVAFGFFLSRRVSRGLGGHLLPRLGVETGAASALETLTFYALMMVSALLALRLVNVPLTVFTFLGGAVAIGVGFGSQNVVNNFISGLILLAERPVRVGDMIEYNNLIGSVKAIGMRSTRLLTGDNLEVIIPNSSLLENNVVNWTLGDTIVRCKVAVGVAYGSPTRDVAKWLRHAADNHGRVLGKPEPFVWFTGFGDSTLDFELNFFLAVRTMTERKNIESDLRFMIDNLLRDAGITIAFPQRDVNLIPTKPLDVRMLPQEDPRTEKAERPRDQAA